MRGILEVIAGILAGTVGTAGGITSLVSYPALLLLGLSPLQANIGNIVALVACWPSSTLASRPELKARPPSIGVSVVVSLLSGVAGAVLLIETPNTYFTELVPFLLTLASVTLITQPLIHNRFSETVNGAKRRIFGIGLILITVYNGYFGAGAGIMLLTLDQVTSGDEVAYSNARKNILIGAATLGSAATLVTLRPVAWGAIAPLSLGLFVGGLLGPKLTRVLPATLLRTLIALLGIGLAASFWIS
ncbi:MAG: sulfite exporter TauE/SafE family protein [Acidimicrobiales bacterium]